MSTPTLLGTIARDQHLRYETFAAEYARTAAEVAPTARVPERAQYYRWKNGQIKGTPYPDACRVLEAMFGHTAAELFQRPGASATDQPSVLASIPGSFDVAALAGAWVTAYRFAHGDVQQYHADIAHVTAVSDRRIRAVNHPPEPRTEGHALPFRNEIEADLMNRHLIGHWRNTSDTRYFGAMQLAVLSGETVMDGYYTGFGSDVEVSLAHWKWVRLDADDDLTGLVLNEPATVHDLVTAHSQYDAPLMITDIAKDT